MLGDTIWCAHAVRLIEEHRFGKMVCYEPPNIASIPILEAIKKLSVVDVSGSAVQAARALGVSFGDSAVSATPFHIRECQKLPWLRNTTHHWKAK